VGGVTALAGSLTPLALALGAAGATWLVVAGAFRSRLAAGELRARRVALITGRRARGTADHGPAPDGAGATRTPGRPRRRFLDDWLRRASGAVDAGPLALVAVAATVGAAAAGGGAFGPAGMAGGAIAAPAAMLFVADRRRKSRRGRVNALLPDLLQVLAGALVAGQSFLQALDQTAGEIPEPLRGELLITLSEVELGEPLERIGDDDLDLVVDAVLIQRRVGGNLAEVLQNIGWTIRERIRIRGEVRSLTGQARMSSWVLGGLPVLMAGSLMLINPAYMAPLFHTAIGHALVVTAVLSEIMGMLIMRRIANVRV
jgi:tight adherence protein B